MRRAADIALLLAIVFFTTTFAVKVSFKTLTKDGTEDEWEIDSEQLKELLSELDTGAACSSDSRLHAYRDSATTTMMANGPAVHRLTGDNWREYMRHLHQYAEIRRAQAWHGADHTNNSTVPLPSAHGLDDDNSTDATEHTPNAQTVDDDTSNAATKYKPTTAQTHLCDLSAMD